MRIISSLIEITVKSIKKIILDYGLAKKAIETPMKFTLSYFTCNLKQCKNIKFKFHCLEFTTAWKTK